MSDQPVWIRMQRPTIPPGRVTTVVAGDRAVCVVHGEDDTWSALDNRRPHQGGPSGDGQLDKGWLICSWHAYQYDTHTGEPPPGFRDAATPYAVRPVVDDDQAIEIEVPAHSRSSSSSSRGPSAACASSSSAEGHAFAGHPPTATRA